MGKWDFYKERNVFSRNSPTIFHKKSKKASNHDDTNFNELERLREDRRHIGSRLLALVNFILLVGVAAIIYFLLDFAAKLVE